MQRGLQNPQLSRSSSVPSDERWLSGAFGTVTSASNDNGDRPNAGPAACGLVHVGSQDQHEAASSGLLIPTNGRLLPNVSDTLGLDQPTLKACPVSRREGRRH